MTLHRKKDLQKGKVKMTRDEAKVMERQTDRQTVVLATVEETVWELFLYSSTHTRQERLQQQQVIQGLTVRRAAGGERNSWCSSDRDGVTSTLSSFQQTEIK